ncbi:periplasmic heavy metal sensor [Oricola thermophila]|uniref:Periplasmic heavy metal sensor n=1 Tax=Oricola thermophila TaxID=2742145 RepID=A0A6N1VF60_9HYPH|nr:periplasmic heavy metal sensor [Oricola thermophila]QKV19378.1 periplasmic heavy metal sensor [Oricola thermophila]
MTARRLNRILVAILVPLAIFAFLSAGAAAWMWRNPGAVLAVRQSVEIYPRDLRRAIRAEFGRARLEVRGEVARVDAARARLYELLREEELDEVAVRAAMADLRDAVSDLQALGHEHLLAVMRGATPEQRAAIRVPERGLEERLGRFAE